MAALVKVMTSEQEKAISELLDGEGVLLVTRTAAEQMKEDYDIDPEAINGVCLDHYDFGGDADIWVDVMRNSDHLAADYLVKQINGELFAMDMG